MTLVLHAHPLSSYCWKVLIALYENGTDFELQLLDLGDESAAAAFRALWPMARMPVLVDDGRTIVESSIIIEHLMLRHPESARLIPDEPEAALEVRLLDRIFDNYVMTPMQRIVLDRLVPEARRDANAVAEARRLLDTSYGWLEERLAGREWAARENFSLADCAGGPALHYADRVHPMGERFPNLRAYLSRLEARPSFARVLTEAEPYRHLFPG